jgi:hypothetical protein
VDITVMRFVEPMAADLGLTEERPGHRRVAAVLTCLVDR